MIISNQKKQDENGCDYVLSKFTYDHNGEEIDIKIHTKNDFNSSTSENFLNSTIVDFEDISHYFIDASKEQLELVKKEDLVNYELQISHLHNNLVEFFYEEEYIYRDKIQSVLKNDN